jgi:two-component system NtrC family sensor kinase
VLAGPNLDADDRFQRALLKLSAAATHGTSSSRLIQLFCQVTRELFELDGTYYWALEPGGRLVGSQADAPRAQGFSLERLEIEAAGAVETSIERRKTVYVNLADASQDEMARVLGAKSLMASPLIVAKGVIGAAVFVQETHAHFFNDDLAARATILIGQLGSLLEANQLTENPKSASWPAEEFRQPTREQTTEDGGDQASEDTGEETSEETGEDTREDTGEQTEEASLVVTTEAHAVSVFEVLAGQLRAALGSSLVCVLEREGSGFRLAASATASPELALFVRSRFDRNRLRSSVDLAIQAVAGGKAIEVAIDPALHALSDLVPSGQAVAVPFRTARGDGYVLVYPRQDGDFKDEERSLIAMATAFAAAASDHAERERRAGARSRDLDQIVGIGRELASIRDLDALIERLLVRATQFLGYSRAFAGLKEDRSFRVRWLLGAGESGASDLTLAGGAATEALLEQQVFAANRSEEIAAAHAGALAGLGGRQLLEVPVLASGGEVLAVLGLLDRRDQALIGSEDIRRAQALATQVGLALEVTGNLQFSDQPWRRNPSLAGLALELASLLRLPEFANRFLSRVADMMGASSAALAISQDLGLETVVLTRGADQVNRDRSYLAGFDRALGAALSRHAEVIVSGPAEDLLGAGWAEQLGWTECALVRLLGPSGELMGVLCLADRLKVSAETDQQLLEAVAGHAAVALENARLFSRMDQANRHWIEIFDAISDFIVAHDSAGKVLRVNRSLADFIGVQPSELIGLNMSALLVTGNDAASGFCPYCRSTGDGTDEYVHPILERTFLVSSSRVHGSASEVLQTIHVLKDITDRREAERRYRELFDNIQEGLFFSTPEGHFVEVNEALVRMLGYENREELLHADVRTAVYSSAERHAEISSYMRQHGVLRNHEETLRRKDGSAVHVLINAFSVRDVNNRIVQYRGLMLDISGLKMFQSELQRERDFSSKILNNTQSLILVADTAGLVSYANRRWYDMGYEQKQILGRRLEELVLPARRGVLSEAFRAILEGNQVDNLDLQVLRADGRVGHFSVNLSPMRDDTGNVTSIVVVMSDITDAATLQAKLVHAEKMAAVGQLVSGVAHEVNNPLTAILGFADLLMENTEVPDSARKDLRVILQEAQRTKQIVQNLLSFARQMPPQRKPVQLNAILRRTLQLRAYDFHSRGVEVVERFTADIPPVTGDAHQLQQVFLNILNNAYDAVREAAHPARIEIATLTRGTFVEISFQDNGHGIAFPDRIFDPFFTTKEVGEGTGLGLSICYGIVREHGGEIFCRNNEPLQGATFIVRLPFAAEFASVGAAAGVVQP